MEKLRQSSSLVSIKSSRTLPSLGELRQSEQFEGLNENVSISTKKYFRFILAIAIAPVLRRIQLEVFPYGSDEAMNTFLGETEVETIGTIIWKWPSVKKYEITAY